MKRDPVLEGRRWLEQAEVDHIGAQLLFDGGSFHLACFVGQQIAGKTIKAFIYSQGEDFVVGHSVEVLCRWASEFDIDFAKLREKIAPLDAYYIPTRYPNGLPDSILAKVYTMEDKMKNIKYVVYKEGKYYVSQCLNVDVSSFGETIDEAIASLKEAVSLYLEDEKNNVEYQVIGETLIGEGVIHA